MLKHSAQRQSGSSKVFKEMEKNFFNPCNVDAFSEESAGYHAALLQKCQVDKEEAQNLHGCRDKGDNKIDNPTKQPTTPESQQGLADLQDLR